MINGAWDVLVVGMMAYFWVETKGKSLEEIDAVFHGEKHSDVPDLEVIRRGEVTKSVEDNVVEIDR